MNFVREEYRVRGYQEVITPLVFNKDLWETSGHWQNYKEDMFMVTSASHAHHDHSEGHQCSHSTSKEHEVRVYSLLQFFLQPNLYTCTDNGIKAHELSCALPHFLWWALLLQRPASSAGRFWHAPQKRTFWRSHRFTSSSSREQANTNLKMPRTHAGEEVPTGRCPYLLC